MEKEEKEKFRRGMLTRMDDKGEKRKLMEKNTGEEGTKGQNK